MEGADVLSDEAEFDVDDETDHVDSDLGCLSL
jgi:hypothetical protein